jgi:hypothetical protein
VTSSTQSGNECNRDCCFNRMLSARSNSCDYIVYLCLYRTFTKSIYLRPIVFSLVATASGLQSSMVAVRVEAISNVIKGLDVISCDSCEGKSASFDVYVDSGIANVLFLRRYCSDCIHNITR